MRKRVTRTVLLLVLTGILGLTIGCGRAGAAAEDTDDKNEQIVETDDAEKDPVNESGRTGEGVLSGRTDNAPEQAKESGEDGDKAADEPDGEGEVSEPSSVTDEGTREEDDEWRDYDSPEAALDAYMKIKDIECDGYVMFDVDADGTEELILTDHGRIDRIFGTYKDKIRCIFKSPDDSTVRLYHDGMLEAEGINQQGDAYTHWWHYYSELGNYLSTFEESAGEYYTFCADDLDKDDIGEIERTLEETGYYPVWLGEWGDMLTKEQYESVIPKTKPIELPEPDDLSDRSGLEVIPEYLLYVNAPDGYVNLRTGPGTEYDIICRIPNDESIESYRKQAKAKNGRNWLKVICFSEADNEAGYKWLTGWVAESQVQ